MSVKVNSFPIFSTVPIWVIFRSYTDIICRDRYTALNHKILVLTSHFKSNFSTRSTKLKALKTRSHHRSEMKLLKTIKIASSKASKFVLRTNMCYPMCTCKREAVHRAHWIFSHIVHFGLNLTEK